MAPEECPLKPGDVGCEECDDWVIVEVKPPSKEHPHGWAVEKCRRKEALRPSGASSSLAAVSVIEELRRREAVK